MLLVDGHLDLAMMAVSGRDLTLQSAAAAPWGDGCVTIPQLREGQVGLALATIFTQCNADPESSPYAYRGHDDHVGAADAGWRQVQAYRELESAGAIRIVRWREELPDAADHAPQLGRESGQNSDPTGSPLPVVLLMEGADPIRDADDAARWHAAGVRAVGLSWAMGSRFAGGDATGGGLTDPGRQLVAALDELGIVHDASHLSADGVDDLLATARGSIVASHSNCRSLVSEHDRHLHDHHVAAIAERGGVVGLNLYTRFLRKDRRATIEDAIAQIERVAEIGGPHATALGSDMDGGFGAVDLPVGLDAPRHLPSLLDALAARGWGRGQVEAFSHANWLRVLHAALPPRPLFASPLG